MLLWPMRSRHWTSVRHHHMPRSPLDLGPLPTAAAHTHTHTTRTHDAHTRVAHTHTPTTRTHASPTYTHRTHRTHARIARTRARLSSSSPFVVVFPLLLLIAYRWFAGVILTYTHVAALRACSLPLGSASSWCRLPDGPIHTHTA